MHLHPTLVFVLPQHRQSGKRSFLFHLKLRFKLKAIRFKLKALLSFSVSKFETGWCFQAGVKLALPHLKVHSSMVMILRPAPTRRVWVYRCGARRVGAQKFECEKKDTQRFQLETLFYELAALQPSNPGLLRDPLDARSSPPMEGLISTGSPFMIFCHSFWWTLALGFSFTSA